MKLKALWQNRLAIQTAVLLLLGFAVIHGASLYVYNTYTRLSRSYLTGPHLAYNVKRIVTLAKQLSNKDLRIVLHHTHYRGIRTRVVSRSAQGIQSLGLVNLKEIEKQILANPRNFHFEIPLEDSHWLLITTRLPKHGWLRVQFILALIVLFAALIALVYWVVQRLVMPLEAFSQAVQRYETDPHAPPVSEAGPVPIRNAIHAFNSMQSKLQQFLNDRTLMLAAISHDLRTPLTRLKLRVEDVPDQKSAEKMNRDLTEMEQMITSILTFARSDASDEPVESFDLNALLDTICDDLTDAGYAVVYHPRASRLVLSGRLNALKRAFTNVIENAVKYGKQADVQLAIRNGKAQIKVNDEGPGIPAGEHKKVFLPFYRANAARTPTTAGSGLGLAVTQEIIRLHNGDIQLRNRKPKGLTVSIDLPLP